jgi:hypothetical protein
MRTLAKHLTLLTLICITLMLIWPWKRVRARLLNVVVFTDAFIDTTLGTSAWAPLPSPQFTYTKLRDTSVLKITYQDTLSGNGPLTGWVCNYQARVDGNTGDPGTLYTPPILTTSTGFTNSYSSAGIFSGLPSGDHQISIWQRNVAATQCIRNSGGYITTVIVEEFEPTPARLHGQERSDE